MKTLINRPSSHHTHTFVIKLRIFFYQCLLWFLTSQQLIDIILFCILLLSTDEIFSELKSHTDVRKYGKIFVFSFSKMKWWRCIKREKTQECTDLHYTKVSKYSLFDWWNFDESWIRILSIATFRIWSHFWLRLQLHRRMFQIL